jgi:predicted nucleotidyltransferase component of viral defense system
MTENHYQNALYPLQNYILSLINKLDLPFYLTGGTALSRHYLFHRYSDDLDLFVNEHSEFRLLIDAIDRCFQHNKVDYRALSRSDDFVRMEIHSPEKLVLKLDLVNDLVPHFGDFALSPELGKVDNVMNILSNKISAIPRLEIKDFADIIWIARKYQFNWETLIKEAFEKDAWVNPLDLGRYFYELDERRFQQIRWIKPVDSTTMKSSCDQIANDIVRGWDNSLYSSGTTVKK